MMVRERRRRESIMYSTLDLYLKLEGAIRHAHTMLTRNLVLDGMLRFL